MNHKLILTFSLIFSSLGYAGDEVDIVKTVSPDGMIRIINTRGDVTIVGWDKDEVWVHGELDDLAEKFIFEVNDKHTLIEVKMPRRNISWGDGSNLEIRVPHNSRVDFEGVSTDTNVSGIRGGLRVKSVSGDIEIDEVDDRIMISAVSGEIQIENSNGALRASTVSGDLEIRSHDGDVELESVSGEIDLFSKNSDLVRVQSVSGEIQIEVSLLDEGQVEIGSVSGEIELELMNEVNAHFQLDAGMGGEIENRISDDQPSRSFIGREKLDMTVGSGSSEIFIRTVSADIRIEN
jgi:hypothetical protein